jgi:hypothetical protein
VVAVFVGCLRWSVRSVRGEGAQCAFDGRAHVKSGVDGEPVQDQSVAGYSDEVDQPLLFEPETSS